MDTANSKPPSRVRLGVAVVVLLAAVVGIVGPRRVLRQVKHMVHPAAHASTTTSTVNAPRPPSNEPETAGGWTKYAGNPVLGGSLGTCFDICVLKEGKSYKMWFSWRPKKSIALTESTDGIHWGEPVIVLGPNPGNDWETDLNRPFVIHNRSGYRMWYTGQTNTQSRIGYATSKDGKVWERPVKEPVLVPDTAWEKAAVMCPHVIEDAATHQLKLWYSGGDQFEPDALGYATSSDGIKWTKESLNPVFTPGAPGGWDGHRVTAAFVIKDHAYYDIMYIGFKDDHFAQIGIARSHDGIHNWERNPANPVIRPGNAENAWDYDAVYKPSLVLDGDRWLLWYNGRHGGVEQIGMAVHQGKEIW